MLDVGLKALNGGLSSLLGEIVEDAKGDLEMADSMTVSMSEFRSTFGRFPLERMGRSRRFFFTLWRSCCSSARSLVISSGRGSLSCRGSFRFAPRRPMDSESDESESESWRVSSKSGASESSSVVSRST